MFSNFYICHQKRTTMKHGIYILTILMALLSLPESGYASIPFFAVANDTIRRVVIYFDANDAGVNPCYKGIRQERSHLPPRQKEVFPRTAGFSHLYRIV